MGPLSQSRTVCGVPGSPILLGAGRGRVCEVPCPMEGPSVGQGLCIKQWGLERLSTALLLSHQSNKLRPRKKATKTGHEDVPGE